MAIGMVVPFFLTPFVVKSLGSTAYGVWILAVSTVSYLNLLDMGMRSAVIRFVSKAQAQNNLQDVQSAIGAALWFRLLLAFAVAVLSVVLAVAFPHWFKIPSEMMRAGQITVLLCALGVAITLIAGVFGAALSAIHRFDVLSSITMTQTLARAAGVLLILHSGHGLVALAVWELLVVTFSGLLTTGVACRLFPPARVRIAKPEMETLKKIWSYSFTTFLWIIAVQIIINTDNLVIGAFLSASVVAFYSIGGSLSAYAAQVVTALSTTFTPLASNLEASGSTAQLQKLLLRGTQATLALALPISLTLLFRGKTFIGLWMGPKYSEISGTVLQILMISQFFGVADSTAGAIVMAIDKHKPAARWAIVEAVLNLGLSIFLVQRVGIYGVAWGTAISMAIVHLTFWPRYVKKAIGVSGSRFLWEGWTKISLCSLPFAAASYFVDKHTHPRTLLEYFAEVLLTLPVFVVCVLVVFRRDVQEEILKRRLPSQPLAV